MIRRYIIEADDSLKGFDEAIEKLEREWGAEEVEGSEDCISRQAAIDVVKKWFDLIELNSDICIDGLISLSTVQPQPKKGKWVERYGEVPIYNAGGFTETKHIGWICSECKELEPRIARFCPNCGADMREVQT